MKSIHQKILILSLLSYTIGGFLFAVGLLTKSFVGIVCFYLIALCLLLSGMLCLYNNYKKDHTIKLFLYLVCIGVFLFILFTWVFIASI